MVKLSVIIPYYKTYELTKKILETLKPQLNDEVEILLIDDGCNELRLDEFKDCIDIEHLTKNIGGAGASNVGIRKAKGEYIGFIDSDDSVSSNYIDTLLGAIKNHTEEVMFLDWQDINTGKIHRRPNNYAPWKAIYKKEIVPMFDEGWIYSFDVPFYDKLNERGYTKYYIDKVLYYYNSNREGNLTTQKEKERRNNMIKVEVIKDFTLGKFNELVDIERKRINTLGKLYVGDTFKCEKEMAEYLMGKNKNGDIVVKIIEVEPVIPKTLGSKDKENIIPLDEENIEKVAKEIKETVKPKKTNKKK